MILKRSESCFLHYDLAGCGSLYLTGMPMLRGGVCLSSLVKLTTVYYCVITCMFEYDKLWPIDFTQTTVIEDVHAFKIFMHHLPLVTLEIPRDLYRSRLQYVSGHSHNFYHTGGTVLSCPRESVCIKLRV
jgi:hypothetical protein